MTADDDFRVRYPPPSIFLIHSTPSRYGGRSCCREDRQQLPGDVSHPAESGQQTELVSVAGRRSSVVGRRPSSIMIYVLVSWAGGGVGGGGGGGLRGGGGGVGGYEGGTVGGHRPPG